jgi:hypothetical protein
MENTPGLYCELVTLLGQHCTQRRDVRHLYTLAWMVVGLILAGGVSLTAWLPYIQSRARYAQSRQRRFARWLQNERIEVQPLYAPLIQRALAEWGAHTLYLALDTSLLWGRYCLLRLAVIYRGRAVPVVWQVVEQRSSSVAYDSYQALLEAVPPLLPLGVKVVFLADRGFADTQLLAHLRRLRWHFRVRIKANFLIWWHPHQAWPVPFFKLPAGRALCLHNVQITADRFGPVSVALAHHRATGDRWYVVSDEPTSVQTLLEYGRRFDIEESFLDDKSNGFQLESSLIRDAPALSRLCLVLAVTTLYLVAQGTAVVASCNRRWVDPHWFRGNSYLQIGWQWVKAALTRGWALVATLHLSGAPDPAPAIASFSQGSRRPPLQLTEIVLDCSA